MDTSKSPEDRAATSSPLVSLVSSCFVGDLDSAADELLQRAQHRLGGYACLCNVHVLTDALHDVGVRAAVEGAVIRFPDGEPVAWLLRRLGWTRARRIGGPDLFPHVVDRARALGLRHLLVGSTDSTLARLQAVIHERYPGAELIGARSLPFAAAPDVEDELVSMVEREGAHFVWVALGAPKQELWMARAAPAMPGAMLVGVGAAFDFLAGEKQRAPETMQRVGLEWLHRLATEPRRLTSRYLRSNSEFVARTGIELTRRRLRPGRR